MMPTRRPSLKDLSSSSCRSKLLENDRHLTHRSIDVTANSCSGSTDASVLADLILRYANSTAQATVGAKTLVSTFSGDGCTFGQDSVAAGWAYVRSLVRLGGKEIYLVPAIFVDPSNFASMTWFDGLLNWDSGWPMGSSPLDTSLDTTWQNNLGNRTYMPAVTPLFFTYYGPNSWNKDWIYVSCSLS
jgi:glucan endo-1,3-alpha-glucosidase